jgi:hypothetical protein
MMKYEMLTAAKSLEDATHAAAMTKKRQKRREKA